MNPPRSYCLALLCILVMPFISCNHPKTGLPAYYFWRTGRNVSDQEKDLLHRRHIQTLYAKILDVDWSDMNGAIPVASLDLDEINRPLNVYDSLHTQIIPVVFITNKTFSNIDSADIPLLAKRV